MEGWGRRRVLLGLAAMPFAGCGLFEAETDSPALSQRGRVVRGILGVMADVPCTSFPFSEQEHACQAATRAWREAPEDEELIVAALCHDCGSLLGGPHGEASAQLLEHYVRPEVHAVVAHHPVFRARLLPKKSEQERRRYLTHREAPWYELALHFSEAFDQAAGDPAYESLPLADFEPMLRRVFARRRYPKKTDWTNPPDPVAS